MVKGGKEDFFDRVVFFETKNIIVYKFFLRIRVVLNENPCIRHRTHSEAQAYSFTNILPLSLFSRDIVLTLFFFLSLSFSRSECEYAEGKMRMHSSGCNAVAWNCTEASSGL